MTFCDFFDLKELFWQQWNSMRWKIKGFEFCEHQQTLTKEHGAVRLEPMTSELLAYFCRHQNLVVSKAQLLEEVWRGRFVSDNTVSKLVTKLRKALKDDARNPAFIVTVPKRGYRFVAGASQITAAHTGDTQQTPHLPKQSKAQRYLFIFLLCAICILAWFSFLKPSVAPAVLSAKAITSNKGSEYFPSFAADGVRLTYMNHDGEKFRLYVKNTLSGEQVEIEHEQEKGVGPASWNDTGTQLVYLVGNPESCQYFIREFNGMSMSAPKLIYTCNPGSYGRIKFTHNDNLLIFAESQAQGMPYSLYSLSLDDNTTQWLPQPDIHLAGNNQFDIHPTENKVLISSPDKQRWEGFYQLDLETQQLSLLFKLNAYICCGIWSHDGQHVVLMGEHPARDIVQYTLDGSEKTVLFSSPLQLHRPERHSNGVDYVFTAFTYNVNVDEYNLADKQSVSMLNDSVDERLAVLSPDAIHAAYVNLSSGNEELWLFNRNTQKRSKITHFEDGRHYLDLAWSPDQMKIAALTLNAIHVIDVKSGKAKPLPLPQKEYRGVSFKSPKVLAFSVKLDATWQVVEYHLEDNSMVRLPPKWKSIQYHAVADNWLWVDQDDKWYSGGNATPFTMPKENVPAFYGRQFNVRKSGQHIAFYDRQKNQLQFFKHQSEKPFVTIQSQEGHFSLNGNIVLTSQKSSSANSSDLYQTYRVPTQ